MSLRFIFIFSIFVISIKAEDGLYAVTLLYRHGDRTPLYFYPTDPYKDPSLWPAPPGELCNTGKLQHYILGKWLRNRYGRFLSPIYDNSELYVRSSDVNRCIMSAAANLAGLYPPQGKDVWVKELLWQPIPIHTMPVNEDDIAEIAESCPKYKRLLVEARNSSFFQPLNEKYKEVYQFLTENTGKLISDIQDAAGIYDILLIESLYNFTLPEWTHEVYPQLIEIGDLAPKIFSLDIQLARLFAGRFLDNVVSQFRHFSQDRTHMLLESENQKFRVFSAHEDQLYGILDALKVQNLKKVPYAAAIIVELRRTDEGKFYVQVLYKAKVDEADVVQIGGCDSKCDLADFKLIVEPLALSDYQFRKECNE